MQDPQVYVRKPRLFIGSSSEALAVAEALFTALGRDTAPTIWKHAIFLPGRYPLEVLEAELENYSFAVLVAAPDDILIKRGDEKPTLRDNVILELGLFIGRIGRRRSFLVTPKRTKMSLPSDLDGLGTAEYDDERLEQYSSELSQSVESASQLIRKTILEQWQEILTKERDERKRVQQLEQVSAIGKLHNASLEFVRILSSVQSEVVSWWRRDPDLPSESHFFWWRYRDRANSYNVWGATIDRVFITAARAIQREVDGVAHEYEVLAQICGNTDQFRQVMESISRALRSLHDMGYKSVVFRR